MAPRKTPSNPYKLRRVTPKEPKVRKREKPDPPRPDLNPGDMVQVVMLQKMVFFDVPTPTKVISVTKREWTIPWWSVEVESTNGTRSFDSSLVIKYKP